MLPKLQFELNQKLGYMLQPLQKLSPPILFDHKKPLTYLYQDLTDKKVSTEEIIRKVANSSAFDPEIRNFIMETFDSIANSNIMDKMIAKEKQIKADQQLKLKQNEETLKKLKEETEIKVKWPNQNPILNKLNQVDKMKNAENAVNEEKIIKAREKFEAVRKIAKQACKDILGEFDE
ncbi:Hypothetical_protein [Hexamita inflata]|uniref:Hypothetical_protein n=1 Tax=Hexamita inflata TaxID=28002 RepID=A0AA86V3I4_9EUKA|nr:Hypothetical protein HINF_LOCUS62566 [Hexamita inflata]